MGLLTALALILSYIEILIPFQTGIPGLKLGLANLAVVLCLYLFGFREAVLLTIVKAVLSGLLFGNLFMVLYSLAGAIFSACIMGIMKAKNWPHVPVVSAMGGVTHILPSVLSSFCRYGSISAAVIPITLPVSSPDNKRTGT